MLIFLVEETLRLNNYIIKFLGDVGKVPVTNKEEKKKLCLFESVSDFSFRSTKVLLHANKQKETKILMLMNMVSIKIFGLLKKLKRLI